jgi:hypothetical protein
MDAAGFWRLFRIAACCLLAACVAVFVVKSIHWRLIGDPAQIDYACFLMDHGMAPYRDLIELNMPGIYLVNWSVMHAFGSSDLAWRLFDLSLLVVAGVAMVSIARDGDSSHGGWFAGVLAAGLFALLHGHGGDEQMGQRDLIIAVLLLLAYAFLFLAMRRGRSWPLFLFGVCGAAASTVKPPAGLFAVALLVALAFWLRARRLPVVRGVAVSLAGMAVPLAIVLIFLVGQGALHAFVHMMRLVLPYYSQLGRKSLVGMLTISKTIPLLGLMLALGAVIAWLRRDWSWESGLLALGILLGGLLYFLQGKGFTYHRYPLVAFLLLWVSVQFCAAARRTGGLRVAGYAGLAMGLVAAPMFTVHAVRTPEWGREYRDALTPDLQALGGKALSGKVQCFTTSGDCDMVLLRMGLVQSTGLFYDFMVFGDGNVPVIRETRPRVWESLMLNPPKVIVANGYLWPNHPCLVGEKSAVLRAVKAGDADAPALVEGAAFGKLATWPELDGFLKERYARTERSFPVTDKDCPLPMVYRIYTLK